MICVRFPQAQTSVSFAFMTIGLTGGIGCGKSSAVAAFAEEGFRTLDSDRIVREEVLTDVNLVEKAIERWGRRVAVDGRTLDRAVVAEIVFREGGERKWWEARVHPRVGAIWRARVAADPQANWLIEVPLLFEAGLEKGFDFVVCVGVTPTTQIARVTARGMSQAQAEQRIESQLPLDKKLTSSHFVLWNEGSPSFLREQVACLAAHLRQPAVGL